MVAGTANRRDATDLTVYRPRFFPARRVRPLLQSEASECGLACLAMIANSLGSAVSLPWLRQRYPFGLRGTTLADLVRIAGALKMTARPVRLEVTELTYLRLPGILHWNLDHFVVLERVNARSLCIVDPAVGRATISLREAAQRFSGVALELLPAGDFSAQQQHSKLRFRDLVKTSPGLLQSLGILLSISLALQVLVLLLPFFSQLVIDEVVIRGDRELLVLLGLSYLLLVSVQGALSMCRAWVVVTAATRLGIDWSAQVFRHLLRLPLSFFEARHVGDVQSRFGSVLSLQGLFTRQAVEVLVDGLMAITTVAVMLAYSVNLTLLVVLSVLLYCIARISMFRPMRSAAQEALVAAAAKEGFFLELLRGMLTVKASGITDRCEAGFLQRLVNANRAQVNVSRWATWQLGIQQLLFGTQLVAVTWAGALAVIDSRMTVGMLVAFLAYRALFTERAAALVDKFYEFRLARVHLERLADIVLSPVESGRPPAVELRATTEPIAITAHNLSYAYAANAPAVLSHVSLRIAPGEHVVLTGASGAGKTTLIKLLMGLLQPESGSVEIDGAPLLQYGVQRYRQQLGAVMQEDRLFSGSLLDNITLFDPQPDIKLCRQCTTIAGIERMIERLPMQYFTPIGDMGAALSGGQRQQLLLARALYRQPRILFLDEFTSHLDGDREEQVARRLADLAMTRIVIAHRRETVRHADREIPLHTLTPAHASTGHA